MRLRIATSRGSPSEAYPLLVGAMPTITEIQPDRAGSGIEQRAQGGRKAAIADRPVPLLADVLLADLHEQQG